MRTRKVILWLGVLLAAMLALGGCQPASPEPSATLEATALPTSTSLPTATRTPKPVPPINLPSPYTGPLPDGVVQQIGLGALTEVSVSPRGTYVALGGDAAVLVYDAQTLDLVWSAWNLPVSSLAWSNDESKLAAGSYFGATVWEGATGREIFRHAGASIWLTDVAFTPDARRLVGATRGGAVKIWNGTTGELNYSLEYHETPKRDYQDAALLEFALSPNGRMAALAFTFWNMGLARTAVVWDIETGERLLIIDEPSPDEDYPTQLYGVTWSPDSQTLAVATHVGLEFRGIQFWDPVTGEKVGQVECCNYMFPLSWSPDGTKLAANDGYTGEIIDAVHYQQLAEFDVESSSEIMGWSADSSQFAVFDTYSQDVSIHDASTGEKVSLPSRLAGINANTPDFKHFFYLTNPGRHMPAGEVHPVGPFTSLVEWDAETQEIEHILATGMGYLETGAAWSPDSTQVAVNLHADGGRVLIWDVQSNTPVAILPGADAYYPRHAPWSPDGKWFAVADDKIITLYDAATWEPLGPVTIVPFSQTGVDDFAWSPDNRRIAVVGEDQLIVSDVHTNRVIFQTTTANDRGRAVAWSGDGTQIATVGDEAEVEVWDAETGERLRHVVLTPKERGYLLSFSRDLSLVANMLDEEPYSCSRTSVWSTDTGILTTVFSDTYGNCNYGHDWAPWLPDGSALALASNNIEGLYDPHTGALIAALKSLPDSISPDGMYYATVGGGSVMIWEMPK